MSRVLLDGPVTVTVAATGTSSLPPTRLELVSHYGGDVVRVETPAAAVRVAGVLLAWGYENGGNPSALAGDPDLRAAWGELRDTMEAVRMGPGNRP